MKRLFVLFYVWLLLSLCWSCSTSRNPTGGSETNWLRRCESQDDCSSGNSCECGICTRPCESTDDCGDVPGAASCLITETLQNGSCRVVAAGESDQGICVARCETDRDCDDGEGFECVSGICVAVKENLSGVEGDENQAAIIFPISDIGKDADVEQDAGPSVTVDDAQSIEVDGSSESPDALTGEPNRTDSSSEQLVDAQDTQPVALGPATDDVVPTCPCTPDIPEDFRAPKAGQFPVNAYGSAVDESAWLCGENDNFRTFGGYIGWQLDDWTKQRYEGLIDLCFSFGSCALPCETDSDCPEGGSGTAVARCSTSSLQRMCYLDCASQRQCPDGMTCITGVDGGACFWAVDEIAPGCPAFCEEEPIPRECQDFCASLYVACDPEKGVDCCEGLVCSEEKYCVQE